MNERDLIVSFSIPSKVVVSMIVAIVIEQLWDQQLHHVDSTESVPNLRCRLKTYLNKMEFLFTPQLCLWRIPSVHMQLHCPHGKEEGEEEKPTLLYRFVLCVQCVRQINVLYVLNGLAYECLRAKLLFFLQEIRKYNHLKRYSIHLELKQLKHSTTGLAWPVSNKIDTNCYYWRSIEFDKFTLVYNKIARKH